MKCVKTIGTRAQVMHGNALKTSGGLRKSDLKMNAAGAIVSRKQSTRAKREESPLLKLWRESVKAVYATPKYRGKFRLIKRGTPFYKEVKKLYLERIKEEDMRCHKRGKKKIAKKKRC